MNINFKNQSKFIKKEVELGSFKKNKVVFVSDNLEYENCFKSYQLKELKFIFLNNNSFSKVKFVLADYLIIDLSKFNKQQQINYLGNFKLVKDFQKIFIISNYDSLLYREEIENDKTVIIPEAYFSFFLLEKEINHHLNQTRLTKENAILSEKLNLYKIVVKNVRESVVATDLEGKIIFWNDSSVKLFGYTATEITGNQIQNFYPSLYTTIVNNFEKTVSGKPFVIEDIGKRKNGTKFCMHIELNVMVDEENKAQGFIGVIRDVTEEKVIRRKLQINIQRYKSLFDHHPDAVYMLDLSGKFISCNKNTEALLGKSSIEIINQHFSVFVPEKEKIRINEFFKKSCSGSIEKYTATNVNNQLLSITNIPLVIEEQVCGIFGIAKDITEKTRSKTELLYKTEELNTFIYRVSHDIRGPLASMLGLCQLSKMKNEANPEQYLEMVEQLALRLDEILKNLLHLTTINKGNPVFQEFLLDGLINKTLSGLDLSNTIIEKDYDLFSKISSDPTILGSILQNIIENSIKYKKTGQLNHLVKISFKRFAEGFLLSICDNGMGIEKEYKGKVFNMFYRTEVSKGSGLGLYIVKNFCEKLNGEISIESEINSGTTINIFFKNYCSLQKSSAFNSDQ